MTGAQTVSVIGTYNTLALAVAAWDSATVTAITDHIEMHVLPGGQGLPTFALLKVETEA